jgi:hypothetical protein
MLLEMGIRERIEVAEERRGDVAGGVSLLLDKTSASPGEQGQVDVSRNGVFG